MKYYFFPFLLLFIISSKTDVFGQNKSIVTNRIYVGNIGTDTLYLHLKESKSTLTGFYFYNKDGELIEVSGKQNRSQKKINLKAYTASGDEILKLKRSNEYLKGKWKRPDTSASVSLHFTGKEFKSDVYFIKDTFLLGTDTKTSPFFDLNLYIEWPDINNPGYDFISQELTSLLDPEEHARGIGMPYLFDTITKYAVSDYLSLKEGLNEEELEDLLHSALLNWSLDSKTNVEIISDKIATIQQRSYGYTGGAHGSQLVSFCNLNLIEKRLIHIDDIFTEEGIKIIPNFIDKRYRSINNIDEQASLYEHGLQIINFDYIPEEFLVTDKGILFLFNEYEIGPYSSGIITVFLPYSILNNYLLPSFKELLKNN